MRLLVHYAHLTLLFFVLIAASACAPNLNHYAKLNDHLRDQNYEAALEVMQGSRKTYAGRNRVLYYLEEGLLAHFAGRFEESNRSLLEAERVMANLYTRSISREAASFLINDNTTEYRGEDFEAALVNLFLALNFAGLGQWEDALVEARKVDSKLNSFNLQYPAGKKNVYKEDAFIRYLMGVLYETENEINDAFISYRKSESVYRRDFRPNYGVGPPSILIEDLLWTARQMQFLDEYRRYSKAYPDVARGLRPKRRNDAHAYFIHFNGLGAEKVERRFFVPMPDKTILKLAYPEYEQRPYQVTDTRISLIESKSGRRYRLSSHLAADISAIARLNLKNRIGRITTKAIARVTAKYLLYKEAEKKALKEGDKNKARALKWAFQAYMIAFEIADIRHWRLLPAQIRISHERLSPGSYEGTIDLLNNSGQTISSRPLAPFRLTAGERKIVTFRTLE